MWASWMVDATVVPLSSHHPSASLVYFLSDAQCRGVIVDDDRNISDDLLLSTTTIDRTERSNALLIYTSGTSDKPKECVLTFDIVQAHIDSMIKAWEQTKVDVILHVLPLHHVHGLINGLLTPLFIGATVIMLPQFDASNAWEHLVQPSFE